MKDLTLASSLCLNIMDLARYVTGFHYNLVNFFRVSGSNYSGLAFLLKFQEIIF